MANMSIAQRYEKEPPLMCGGSKWSVDHSVDADLPEDLRSDGHDHVVVRGAAPTVVGDLANELLVHLGLPLESSVENVREERGQLCVVAVAGFPHGLVGLALDRTGGVAIDGDNGMRAGGSHGTFGGSPCDVRGLGRLGLRGGRFRGALFGQLGLGRSGRSGDRRRALLADAGTVVLLGGSH